MGHGQRIMADTIGTNLLIVPLFGAMFWVGRQLGRRIDDLKTETGKRIDDLKTDMNRQFDERAVFSTSRAGSTIRTGASTWSRVTEPNCGAVPARSKTACRLS